MSENNLYYEYSLNHIKKWLSALKMPIGIFSIICCLFFSAANVFAQNAEKLSVTGIVNDAAGMPLIGVSVTEVGTTNGTITDMDGKFELKVVKNATINFSYMGYETVTRKVSSASIITVVMKEDVALLDEIVVIGYGTQRKQDLTGAVGVVDMKEAQKLTAGSIAETLQGQVAGVSVISDGTPGSMGKINIRGIGSFSNVNPLYVVDGVITEDMNHINPSDIETMQILKDAASAAIYGSRGANGVIIVTTKRGKNGQPSLNFSATYGVQEMAKKIKMKNTVDFLHYNELAYINAAKDWPANPEAGTYLPNSDFQRAILQTGHVQDYNATYTQGSEKTSLMMGAGYFNQEGVLKGPKYERMTYRVNSEGRYGIFKIGENISISQAKIKETNTSASSFTNALLMPPVLPVYDPEEPRGGFGHGNTQYPTYTYNPLAQQQTVDDRAVHTRLIGNVYAELELFKLFTYKFNLGVDYWQMRRRTKDYGYTIRMGSAEQKFNDAFTEVRDERTNIIAENTLNYKQQIGKHNLEGLLGFTYENKDTHYLGNVVYNQKVPGLWETDLGEEQFRMWGSEIHERMISYLGRLSYNYDNRYLLQVNMRSDGSSRFGPDKRRGYFPSVSAGWRISNEKFFEPLKDIFDDLKLRSSYGKIGDMQALPNYRYIPVIDHNGPYEGFFAIFGPTNGESVNIGALQSSSINRDLGWETKTTFNVGIDFSLLNNKLYGSFEWYDSKSSDLLVHLPLPYASGVMDNRIWTNYGKMTNRGIELSLGWRDRIGDFNYNVSGNIYTVRNEVTRLGDKFQNGGWNGINQSEKGRSIGDFYLIKSDGIFQNMDEVFAHTTTLNDGTVVLIQPHAKPGDVRYVDHNGDGKIDLDDRQWMGSPLPKFQAGLNFSANYKGFDFTMFWNASYGNKIFNVQRHDLMNFNVDNYLADVTPWTWDNPSNKYPRPLFGTTDNVKPQTDRFLENGSFLRLKNLQFGYSLPASLTKKISIERCRIYVSGQNLVTITKYKGYDPEILNNDVVGRGNDEGSYPPVRTYNIGLQLAF